MSRARPAALLGFLALTGGPIAVVSCGPADDPALRAPVAAETAAPSAAPEPALVSERPLPADGPEERIEREMSAGEIHRYPAVLDAGRYLEIAVEQRGVDVEVELFDPAGAPVLARAADSPTSGTGVERLGAVARVSGRHVVEVRPFEGIDSTGRYALTVVANRPAGERDRRRAEAFAELARGKAERRSRDAAERAAALSTLERALALWRALDDPRGRAVALFEIGLVHDRVAGREAAARRAWERSAALFREAGEASFEGEALDLIARLDHRRGALRPALAGYRAALERQRAGGNRVRSAKTLNQIALCHHLLRQPRAALDHYTRAIGLWEEIGARFRSARPLHNRAWVFLELGRLRDAERDFDRALALRREEGNRLEAAKALLGLAHVDEARARAPAALRAPERREAALTRALDRYREALSVFESRGETFDRGVALGGIGGTLSSLGRWRESHEALRESLEVFRALDDPRHRGQAHLDLGEWAARQGLHGRARESYRRALALLERAGDDDGRAAALSWIAASHRAEGRLAEATAALDDAIAIVEGLRVAVPPGVTLRASFLATKQNYFEEAVDLLMERHERDPDGGFDARALEIHERSRARSLLDTVAAPDEREVAGAALSRPLTTAAVRRLLDDETLLIEYHLGPARSFGWAVDRGGVASFVLPPGPEIEALALEGHRLLSAPPTRQGLYRTEETLGRASELLLAPVLAAAGDRRRLVIVAHGALQYLPFAALPLPGGSDAGEPLIARHELVHLPSASLLAALRARDRGRSPAAGRVAVVADPVFGPDDPRLEGASARSLPGDGYPRLVRSRREAEEILRLVPPSRSFAAFGFDATKELVTGALPGRYRILHLATHGEIDATGDRSSRLLFSRLRPDGRRRDGVLDASELYGLEIPVDLVVLSACQTALGEEVRGEGLVGLAHGFFHAGGSRLMASLWSVDDAATAELMAAFYRELLAGDEPAAALRRAQLAVRREPAWSSPYFWASFVLEGEWRWPSS